MTTKLKQLLFVQILIISVIYFALSFASVSFAQGKDPGANTERKYQQINEKDLTSDDGSSDDNATTQGNSDHIETRIQLDKKSAAYQVLGRKLTLNERELYGDLNAKELEDQLLYKEYKLVVVRALLAVGEGETIKKVLEIIPTTSESDQKTFLELYEYFTKLREKYGSVLEGLKTEVVERNTDDKYAFENTAQKAYEEVFGVKLAEEDKQQLLSYFKERKISTYSEMVNNLVQTMSPGDKKDVLIRALEDTGRPDLKENTKFIAKILGQNFTYVNLMELFKPLKKTQPAPSKQPAKK